MDVVDHEHTDKIMTAAEKAQKSTRNAEKGCRRCTDESKISIQENPNEFLERKQQFILQTVPKKSIQMNVLKEKNRSRNRYARDSELMKAKIREF